MADLTTSYLGMELRSPFVASAGPVTGDPGMWRRLEDAGASAVVLPSLAASRTPSRRSRWTWSPLPPVSQRRCSE